MEIVVTDKLKEVKDSLDCCRCDGCMMDIATYVLNRLPPKYVASTRGEVFSLLEVLNAQYSAEILMRIMEASQVIREHPRHAEPPGK
jgi:competence protein ComFB